MYIIGDSAGNRILKFVFESNRILGHLYSFDSNRDSDHDSSGLSRLDFSGRQTQTRSFAYAIRDRLIHQGVTS